jgi:splicing factor 3B subunit 3
MRSEVDPLSGALSDVRKRYLGTRPPTLLPVTTASQAMLALTSRPWLAHFWQGKFELVPLAYDALDYVAPFASEKVPEGLVAVVRNATGTGTLRVLTLERLAEQFTQKTLPLAFTPRRMLVHDVFKTIITAEADKGAIPYAERTDLQVHLCCALAHV